MPYKHNAGKRHHIPKAKYRAWQKAVGYGRRALAELMMACYKTLIGSCLRARKMASQQTEVATGVAVRTVCCRWPGVILCVSRKNRLNFAGIRGVAP